MKIFLIVILVLTISSHGWAFPSKIPTCFVEMEEFKADSRSTAKDYFEKAVTHCPNSVFGDKNKAIVLVLESEFHWGHRITQSRLCWERIVHIDKAGDKKSYDCLSLN